MPEELQLAAVGVGGIWKAHARNLALLNADGQPNRVVAVCDLSEQNRDASAQELNARAYADLNELLEREQINGLISCTPPGVRRAVIEAATARGVPVFVEKPPASTLDDARAIAKLVRERGVPVVAGFMYRYLPAANRLKELLADKPISLVQSSFTCPAATAWPLPAWFYIKEKSGGHVLDQAIHVLDLLRFFAGDITQVHTFGSNVIRPKTEAFTVEDSSSSNLRFVSGASGGHAHSWAHSDFTGMLSFWGEDFRLTLHLDARVSGFIGDQKIEETFPDDVSAQGASHHYEEMRAFLSSVQSGDFSSARSPFADAAKSLATVLAMNQSIESGQPESVELEF